jgi:hypothetical protein
VERQHPVPDVLPSLLPNFPDEVTTMITENSFNFNHSGAFSQGYYGV